MFKRIAKKFCLAVFLVILPFVVLANELPVLDGMYWVDRMHNAYQKANYELLLAKVSLGDMEPIQYTNGVIDQKHYLHWFYLNGLPTGFFSNDKNLVYFMLGKDKLVMPNARSPTIFTRFQSQDIKKIQETYNATVTGKFRIANRSSIAVRLVPKKLDHYNLDLWIDEQTGVLLQMQVVDPIEGVRESFLLTKFNLFNEANGLIKNIDANPIPEVADSTKEREILDEMSWSLGFIPQGFSQVFAQKYLLSNSNIPVEHVLYSDGLVEFSVYRLSQIGSMDFKVVKERTVNLFRREIGNKEIVVIGELPLIVTEKIAQGVKVND